MSASAAVAIARQLEVPAEKIAEGLGHFRGVDRRFQLRGTAHGVTVVDDYGHHPTEIRATLAAARECGYEKIHVVFQPHRYTRTLDLLDQFTGAFADADSVIVLPIYAASEEPIPGVTAERLAAKIEGSEAESSEGAPRCSPGSESGATSRGTSNAYSFHVSRIRSPDAVSNATCTACRYCGCNDVA